MPRPTGRLKYRLTGTLAIGLADAPPIEVEVKSLDELLSWVREELANDYGDPFAPPFTLLIEAI